MKILAKIIFLLFIVLNSQADNKINIITTLQPIASIINEMIEENQVRVEALLSKGDVHNQQLTLEDLKKVQNSDVFVYLGEEFESKWSKIKHKNMLDLSQIKGLKLLNARSSCNHTSHNHKDPHFWLSRSNLQLIVSFLQQKLQLSKISIDNNKIENMLKKIDKIIVENQQNGEYIITHDALQYVEQDFPIKPAAIIYNNHNHEISLNKLQQLNEQTKKVIPCLLIEQQFGINLAAKIKAKLGIESQVISIENFIYNDQQKSYRGYTFIPKYDIIYRNIIKNVNKCLIR
jgi:ABC-type Zn uptake system ZnuABC Zn-binding protein ZnuA